MTLAGPDRIAYGEHPDQHVILMPGSPGASGSSGRDAVVALLHGGYWREEFTTELMEPLVQWLTGRGWTVANVEYRRGPRHRWPIPEDDARAGLRAIRARLPEHRLATVGHSVGGQLALLTGDEVDAIVALGPVTDTARTFTEQLGENAASEYFAGSPERMPEVYAASSPIHARVPSCPMLVVHGLDDDRVPLAHSVEYLVIAQAAGSAPDSMIPARMPHRALADPTIPWWPRIEHWLTDALR